MQSQLTFDQEFLNEIKERKLYDSLFLDQEWPKLQQAAEVHGYRGASKKKHNGIVPIRPTDKGLFKTLTKLTEKRAFKIPPEAIPVKAVAHCPSGNRLVGYYWLIGTRKHVNFLGVANYAD